VDPPLSKKGVVAAVEALQAPEHRFP